MAEGTCHECGRRSPTLYKAVNDCIEHIKVCPECFKALYGFLPK